GQGSSRPGDDRDSQGSTGPRCPVRPESSAESARQGQAETRPRGAEPPAQPEPPKELGGAVGQRQPCRHRESTGCWPYHHRIATYYSRNPWDSNSCCGTSIGENFNCSFAPSWGSNFK